MYLIPQVKLTGLYAILLLFLPCGLNASPKAVTSRSITQITDSSSANLLLAFPRAGSLVDEESTVASILERYYLEEKQSLVSFTPERSVLNDPRGTSLVLRNTDSSLSTLDRRWWNLLIWGSAKMVTAVIATAAFTVASTCGVGAALISKGFVLAGSLVCAVPLAFGLLAAGFAIMAGYYAAAAAITAAAVGVALSPIVARDERTHARTIGSTQFIMHHHETGEIIDPTTLRNATFKNPIKFITGGTIGQNMSAPVTYWRGINPQTNTTGHFLKIASGLQLASPANSSNAKRDNQPHEWYYGFDDYADSQNLDFGNALGGEEGFNYMVQGVADVISWQESWDTCICTMVDSTWKTTGAIQASWDDVYNGYGPCWNANCDGT
jgi:hypothetical protein